MRFLRASLAAASFVTLLALAGCGDSSMADVKGSVSVDGKPLDDGGILFTPADGKSQTAGGLIKGGQYSVKVPVTPMKVSISMPKVVGHKKLYNTPGSKEYPVTKESLPSKYNEKTELQMDVKPGVNQKDWELHSK